MKKEFITYACTLALGIFGVSSFISCSASRSVESVGRAIIVVNDTTIVNHVGSLTFKNK